MIRFVYNNLMATSPPTSTPLSFGPFEVDLPAGELRKNGVQVQLPQQALRILRLLLAHAGVVVTREQLREELWSEGTFVDFERGLNSAMNRLRRALSDSAESGRYIETVPGQGYRFIAPISEPAPPATEKSVAEPRESKRRRPKLWWWLAVPAASLISFVFGWQIHRSPIQPGPWQLSQLTSDSGLSYCPAISRDGTLVAYSSDRAAPGQLDLYMKQVRGDVALRLTFDGLQNTTPDFSPDGSKIVFHSIRDGGGIYEIPAFGGQPRLIAKEGQNPKFSPDGSQIAYWIGGENVASAVPGSGTVWATPMGGGQPRQLGAQFTGARNPIWSPDGKSVLIVGYTSSKAYDRNGTDWWLLSLDGKRSVKTGMSQAIIHSEVQALNIDHAAASSVNRISGVPYPACWSTSGAIIFSAQSGYTQNLWQTTLSSETGKVSGDLNRLTVGAANEWQPSCAEEQRVVFDSMQVKRNVWSFAYDLNAGRSMGAPEQVTNRPEGEEHAALSRDGRYVAFASPQTGSDNIWLQEIATGKESRVTESHSMQRFPVISPSSKKVAFSLYSSDGSRSVLITAPGGALSV